MDLITSTNTCTLSIGKALYILALYPPKFLCPFRPLIPASFQALSNTSFLDSSKILKETFILERSSGQQKHSNNGFLSISS